MATVLASALAVSLAANFFLGWQTHALRRHVERLQNRLSSPAGSVVRHSGAAGDAASITTDLGGEIFLERTSIEVTTTPRFTDETVRCALCAGEGRLQLRVSRKTYSSYPCPVCAARGKVTVRLPRHSELCSACGGIGRVGVPGTYDEGTTHTARLCVPCNGGGWVRKRS